MKKRIISLTIFVLSFIAIFSAKAAARYDISGVNKHLQRYNDAVSELSSLNCDGELNNQSEADRCNNLNLQKATALAYMYNAREYDEDLTNEEVVGVLNSNSSDCSTIYSSELQDAINKVFLLFYIAGPILLILFGSLDLTRAIVAGDEKKRKALYTKFIRRSIALVLLFVSPVIVNLLVNTFGADKYAKQTYSCNYTEKKAVIKYTPVVKTSSGRNRNTTGNAALASKIIEQASAINQVSSQKKWTYKCVGIDTILSNYENKRYGTECCADYVSTVLYLAGAFSKEEIKGMNNVTGQCGEWRGHTYATGVQAFLKASGWIQISDIDDLQAGDIVFTKPQSDDISACINSTVRAGHVEIYAGDGKKFNAGNDGHIQSSVPVNVSYSKPYFIEAYRAPGGNSNNSTKNIRTSEASSLDLYKR